MLFTLPARFYRESDAWSSSFIASLRRRRRLVGIEFRHRFLLLGRWSLRLSWSLLSRFRPVAVGRSIPERHALVSHGMEEAALQKNARCCTNTNGAAEFGVVGDSL